jgi:AcrR family transcriptional regulator
MTPRPDPPRSRRERPAKPALTRDGIIATAVAMMRAEGLDRVTMRRLAQELDTGPASLYVYVRNTAELHAAVLDELMGAVDLSPVTAGGDWRDRLVQVLTSYTTVLFEYPGLAQSALVSRPSGERYLDLAEALLSLLTQGGVPAEQAAWGLDQLLLVATATAAEHATQQRAVGAQDDWDALTTALQNASTDTHPHIAALSADLVSGSGPARLIWSFRMMIDGMMHTPLPDRAPSADGLTE